MDYCVIRSVHRSTILEWLLGNRGQVLHRSPADPIVHDTVHGPAQALAQFASVDGVELGPFELPLDVSAKGVFALVDDQRRTFELDVVSHPLEPVEERALEIEPVFKILLDQYSSCGAYTNFTPKTKYFVWCGLPLR